MDDVEFKFVSHYDLKPLKTSLLDTVRANVRVVGCARTLIGHVARAECPVNAAIRGRRKVAAILEQNW